MTPSLAALSWPLERVDDAIDELVRQSGLALTASARPTVTMGIQLDARDPQAFGRAIEARVSAHGLEVEPLVVRYRDATRLHPPMLVRVPVRLKPDATAATQPDIVATVKTDAPERPMFLAILAQHGKHVILVGADRSVHRVRLAVFGAALRSPLDAPDVEGIDRLLAAASVPDARRPRVMRAMLAEQLGEKRLTDAWHLSAGPGADFVRQLKAVGAVRRLAGVAGLHALQFTLWIAAWWLVGRAALEGRTDWGWLTAWLLLLATIVPLQIWTTWLQGTLAIGVGTLLKRRLLLGALRLEPEEIRQEGSGQLLGRVIESEAVESLALSGGLQAVLAGVELALAAGVLALGATGGAHVTLLVAWVASAVAGAAVYYKRRRGWSAWRLTMTHDLVERLAGHRTRLAQERGGRWHEDEDRGLEEYLTRARALDAVAPLLLVAMPRGWMVAAVAVTTVRFAGNGASPAALAISFGGIILGYLALRHLGDGLSHLAGAGIAWTQARPLLQAAARREAHTPMILAESGRTSRPDRPPVLDVRDVAFRYPNRSEPVLHGCSLRADAGERILLQGPSGGGKSTFASIVAGLRAPSSGLVLLDGLDRRTFGPHGWRRRIVAAPQFHENHVLTETFAFNLLMGRRWPPDEADMIDAERTCRELGLGPLLARMPAGILQMVGEGGWQLSHGERSRLFVARALLQGGDVMLFDESFAALDPESLREALGCVLKRAPTLLVIAHP
jgi:ATP-binding cassette subfamily B protein